MNDELDTPAGKRYRRTMAAEVCRASYITSEEPHEIRQLREEKLEFMSRTFEVILDDLLIGGKPALLGSFKAFTREAYLHGYMDAREHLLNGVGREKIAA